jgi:hypothetical protein
MHPSMCRRPCRTAARAPPHPTAATAAATAGVLQPQQLLQHYLPLTPHLRRLLQAPSPPSLLARNNTYLQLLQAPCPPLCPPTLPRPIPPTCSCCRVTSRSHPASGIRWQMGVAAAGL